MKIQHIAIIFIIIMVPVLLVLQYYIDLQSDTLLLQAEYDEKLVSATKQALEAFEINTVEWNSETSDLSDSLRRDITASVNVFVNSMANNLGIGGASRELILSYIPAVAFTLNDGYYIYTPTYVPITAKDENGLTKKNENGEILYKKKKSATGETTTSVADAQTEYKHVLKTFVPYQKQLGNYIFNFSLDNYVKVYAKVGVGENEEIIKRSGHYDNSLDITDVKPEILTENILVNNDGTYNVENYQYVYDQHGEKVYYDVVEEKFFTLKLLDGSKNYLADTNSQEDIGYRYKTLLQIKEDSENTEYKILYQGLNGERKGKWYIDKNFDGYLEASSEEIYLSLSGNYGLNYDFSAINYYVEAITFTNWIETIEKDLNLTDKDEFKKIFDGGDLTTNSVKRKIIRESIETNLQLAMATYKKYSGNKYELPYFKEVEWERIYSNVSIITFFEGAPIGLKTYSNYAIETSTNNNVYVSEDCLHYQSENDDYYHKYGCEKIVSTNNDNIKAYKNIDYIMQNETYSDITKNYYKHTDYSDKDKISCACYYCLVSEAEYQPTNANTYENARNLAIAREKYVNSVMLYEFNQEIEETNDYSEYLYQIYYDETVVAGKNKIQDVFDFTNMNADKNFIVRISNSSSSTIAEDVTTIQKSGNNTVNIEFSSSNIETYNFNVEQQLDVLGGTLIVNLGENQKVNIFSNVNISDGTLNITGEGQLNTRKLIATGGSVSSEDKTNWIIEGGVNKENATLNLGNAEMKVDGNNYIDLNSFTSNGGTWKFDSNELSANGGEHTINIKTFISDKELICKENTKLDIYAQNENDNKFEISNNISNSGTISINDNIDIKVGDIENNNAFNIGGLGTGAEGKDFNCGKITNNGTLNIKNTGDFSFNRELKNNRIMTISNKGNVEEQNEKEGIWNSGELTINNIGNIEVCYFANKKICSLKNNGNIIIPKIFNYTTESLTLANTGDITLEELIDNNKGTLNINGTKTITGNSENIIKANAGSRINIEPGTDKTIKFVNNTTSGRVLTMYSASEAANTSTTWSTDRTIVNIKNGNITSNVSGILQYGGKLNIDSANITVTEQGTVLGATHIIQSALESAHENARAYPRISIKDSKLTLATEREDNVAIAVEQGILQIENSTINSDACGIQTFLSHWDTSIRALHQKPSGYGDGDWYRSVNNNNIVISDRTELPIVVIDNSTISTTKNYAILHGFGYMQVTNSTIKRETSGEGNDADSDVWLYYSAGGYMKTVLMYDQSSSNFYFSVPDFNTGFKKYSPSNSPGPGNMNTFNLERTTISTFSQKEFLDVILNLPINH